MSRTSHAVNAGFAPITIIVLVLVGVVSLAGLGTLSAYAPELKTGDDGGAHALSNASIGFSGIVKLLRLTEAPVTLSRGRIGRGGDDSLVVLTPAVETSPDQLADYLGPIHPRRRSTGPGTVPASQASGPPTARPIVVQETTPSRRSRRTILRHAGPTLVVLPKWSAVPETRRHGWVNTAGVYPERAVVGVLPADFRKGVRLRRRPGGAWATLQRPTGQAVGRPVRIDDLQTLSGPDWIPVITDASGGAVVAMKAGTWTYVLADPDLINTQALKSLAGAETAVAVLGVVRASGSPVIFDLTLHGFQRTRSLLRLMLEPPLLGLTLVLAALAALAGFQAAVRFGPAREAGRTVAFGKRALADNTAGLVRLARREHRMAAPYAVLVRTAAARAIGAPRTLSDTELDAFLDRVGVLSGVGATWSVLKAQAAAATTPQDLMQVARDLYRWKQEMIRGRS